jgi:hypothetical protein
MQLLNSPIINDHYLIVHTFSGVTAQFLYSYMGGQPATPYLCAKISSLQFLLDWKQTVTIT